MYTLYIQYMYGGTVKICYLDHLTIQFCHCILSNLGLGDQY